MQKTIYEEVHTVSFFVASVPVGFAAGIAPPPPKKLLMSEGMMHSQGGKGEVRQEGG